MSAHQFDSRHRSMQQSACRRGLPLRRAAAAVRGHAGRGRSAGPGKVEAGQEICAVRAAEQCAGRAEAVPRRVAEERHCGRDKSVLSDAAAPGQSCCAQRLLADFVSLYRLQRSGHVRSPQSVQETRPFSHLIFICCPCRELLGPVTAIAALEGLLVVAAGKSVEVHEWVSRTHPPCMLRPNA